MPHTPFKSSPHTSNGKPDPSMQPFAGLIGGVITSVTADAVVVTLNRALCSLRGLPGGYLSVSTDGSDRSYEITTASLNGQELTLGSNTAIDDTLAVVIDARDPALRGPIGEFADPAPMRAIAAVTPVPVALTYDVDNHRWLIDFNTPVEIVGPGFNDALFDDGFTDQGMLDQAGNTLVPVEEAATLITPTRIAVACAFDQEASGPPPVTATLKNLDTFIVQSGTATPATAGPTEVPYTFLQQNDPPRVWYFAEPVNWPGTSRIDWDQPVTWNGGADDIESRLLTGQYRNTGPATPEDAQRGAWDYTLDALQATTLPNSTITVAANAFTSDLSGIGNLAIEHSI